MQADQFTYTGIRTPSTGFPELITRIQFPRNSQTHTQDPIRTGEYTASPVAGA